jgi:hypothetical protein
VQRYHALTKELHLWIYLFAVVIMLSSTGVLRLKVWKKKKVSLGQCCRSVGSICFLASSIWIRIR